MKRSWMEPTYEAARTWALQPTSHPPAGWAQIVRRGIATMPQPSLLEAPSTSSPILGVTLQKESGLLTILATMIAEVCQ